MTLRPLRDFVIVRPLTEPKAGLIDMVRIGDKWRRGMVLAVGPGKRDKHGVPRAWGAAVGDIVQFSDVLTYPEFNTGTERVLVIQEADICGVEEPDMKARVPWSPGDDEHKRLLAQTQARFERVA